VRAVETEPVGRVKIELAAGNVKSAKPCTMPAK
jgi:hypothetical protein